MNAEAIMTPLEEAILETVRAANGEWLSRRDIAGRIGRTQRLNPYDVLVLEGLVGQGLIESSQRIKGTVKAERIYRAKWQSGR